MSLSFRSEREALLQSVHVFLFVLEVAPDARRALDGAGYTDEAHARAWALFWALNDVRVPGSEIAARKRGWKPPPAAIAALAELVAWYARWSAAAREAVEAPIARRVMRLDEPVGSRPGAPALRTSIMTATPIDAADLAALHGQPAPESNRPVRLVTGRWPPLDR